MHVLGGLPQPADLLHAPAGPTSQLASGRRDCVRRRPCADDVTGSPRCQRDLRGGAVSDRRPRSREVASRRRGSPRRRRRRQRAPGLPARRSKHTRARSPRPGATREQGTRRARIEGAALKSARGTQRSCAAVAGRKTIACPPARVRSPAQEACGAEDLTGHGPFGSVSGHVSLLVR